MRSRWAAAALLVIATILAACAPEQTGQTPEPSPTSTMAAQPTATTTAEPMETAPEATETTSPSPEPTPEEYEY